MSDAEEVHAQPAEGAAVGESQQGSKTKRPVVMPDIYTGEEEWSDWLFQFESCAALNDWDDDLKCKFIIVRLKGTAGKALSDLDTETKKDWKKLRTELGTRFDTTTRPDLYKSEFMGRKRKETESYLELGNSIRTLARKAYPSLSNSVRDELAKDQFLRGLDKTELALKVRHANPKTLDEAIRMTLEWEAVEKDVKNLNKGPEPKVLAVKSEENVGACANIASNKTDELIGLMSEMLKMMKDDREAGQFDGGQRRGRGRGQRVVQCWNCKENGHTSRECQKPSAGAPNFQQGPNASIRCWNCGKNGHLSRNCPAQQKQGN